MCGIAGIVSIDPPPETDIRVMTGAIAHRGPDADGYFVNDRVALGHRRLSVIDLDARSNQPFFSKDGRYVIVYNGEIFNFKKIAEDLASRGVVFRTTSDTEVLLEAFSLWGPGFVHRLNGMFAFVIYDLSEQKFFIYRDRLGKKPLFYYQDEKIFLFASELKSILRHPRVSSSLAVDYSTISKFLQLGYIPQPKTFYKSIYKFPSGHYGILSSDLNLSILPYWDIRHYITTSRPISEAKAFHHLKEVVNDSVHSRLVADVPIGIFLSGGIDSSLVSACAAKIVRPKTFSIGFKESKFDESQYAQKVSAHLNTEHQSYMLHETEAVEMVDQYINHFDEPFADTSAIPTMLVSKLARKEVTVALTGDGGDELSLGYGSYTWAERLGSPWWVLFSPIVKQALRLSPSSRYKRASYLFDQVPSQKKRQHIFSQEQYFFSEIELKQTFQKNQLFTDWEYDDLRHLSLLSEAERQALFDFQYYLKDDLLVKVDRASMIYGLECRCPLLDHRLVEFAINLPEPLKKRNGVTKYLMRKMLYEMVPEKIFNRPKWGFSIPLSQWMRNDLSYLMNYLSEEELSKTKVFNVAFINDLKDRFAKGEDYLYNRLWAVIVIQKFLTR